MRKATGRGSGRKSGERLMRVLIVDDDASGRYLLQKVLESGGHSVTTAVDGVDALERARVDLPDLVISDILMPRMDGYQLCREWKADPGLGCVPLVLYTASYTDAADERFAAGLGADAYWRKPTAAGEILRRIEMLGATGSDGVRTPKIADEASVLREHNARLIEKLEQKARGLEQANRELKAAGEALAHEVAVKEQLIAELSEDVIERRRMEAEIRRERDFSRQVLEVSDLFVCILDIELRVILFSAGAERVTGFRAEEVLGLDGVERFVPPERRDRARRVFGSLECGDMERREMEVLTADGGRRTLEYTVACADGPDGPRVYNIFGVDVTERRRLERLKGDFIQMVSHELRTPLTSIIGFGDMLQAVPADRLAERVPVIADRLGQNAQRMRLLVDELLEVNDIVAEGISLLVEPVDLLAVVRHSAEAVFRTPAHRLVVEAAPQMPQVRCDPWRMGRVVTNLVSNAVKYSPEGGLVRVRVFTEDPDAVISIADEGTGIAADELKRLFEWFSQVDMSSTRAFGGIGLGLYIVDEIVRAHGGSVRVSSEPGVGSTFEVRIPMTADDE